MGKICFLQNGGTQPILNLSMIYFKILNIFQIWKEKALDLWVLFTNWGRIQQCWGGGIPGQYQNTPFNTAEQAVAEFEKIFNQKTGNRWSDRENFEKKSFKYRLVEQELRKQVKWKGIKLDLDFSLTASNLDEEVKKVIKDISSASTYMAFRDVGGTNEGK